MVGLLSLLRGVPRVCGNDPFAERVSKVTVIVFPASAGMTPNSDLDDESWETSAEKVGMPPRSCYRRAQSALDLVDFLSPEVVMAGEGGAT